MNKYKRSRNAWFQLSDSKPNEHVTYFSKGNMNYRISGHRPVKNSPNRLEHLSDEGLNLVDIRRDDQYASDLIKSINSNKLDIQGLRYGDRDTAIRVFKNNGLLDMEMGDQQSLTNNSQHDSNDHYNQKR